MEFLFWFFGVFCLAYYGVIVCYSGPSTSFAPIWLVLSACLFIIATVVHFYDRFRDRISLRLEVSAVTALTAIFVVFVCVEIAMGVNFFSLDKQSADYVIVLGAQVRGKALSRTLEYRLEKALELGATGVINGAKEDVIAKAQELTGGAGMDLIIETAGTEITTRQAIHMAKKGSTIVLVGYSKSGEMTLPMSLVLDKELTFKTVFRYRHIYPIAIDAVASGKVNVKGIVTNIYDLDDVQRAMDESVHNKADIVKGVIKIHP